MKEIRTRSARFGNVRSLTEGSLLACAAALLLAATTSSLAHATQYGQSSIISWRTMDKCNKQAQLAFPDFTEEANAKRDAMVKNCLNGANLPPREALSPR